MYLQKIIENIKNNETSSARLCKKYSAYNSHRSRKQEKVSL